MRPKANLLHEAGADWLLCFYILAVCYFNAFVLLPGSGGQCTCACCCRERRGGLRCWLQNNFGIDIPICPVATGTAAIFNRMARLVGSQHRLQAFQENPEMNRVDAAIARPISADLVEKRILEVGEPQGVGEGALGLKIRKSGRTTGLTSGEITQVDATVDQSHPERRGSTGREHRPLKAETVRRD